MANFALAPLFSQMRAGGVFNDKNICLPRKSHNAVTIRIPSGGSGVGNNSTFKVPKTLPVHCHANVNNPTLLKCYGSEQVSMRDFGGVRFRNPEGRILAIRIPTRRAVISCLSGVEITMSGMHRNAGINRMTCGEN